MCDTVTKVEVQDTESARELGHDATKQAHRERREDEVAPLPPVLTEASRSSEFTLQQKRNDPLPSFPETIRRDEVKPPQHDEMKSYDAAAALVRVPDVLLLRRRVPPLLNIEFPLRRPVRQKHLARGLPAPHRNHNKREA